ncbi:STN domain-containing protein [Aquipseudomonas alcaligenes]
MSMEAVARGCLAPAVLIVLFVAACCLAALPCMALAGEGRAEEGPLEFDLPAQDLSQALERFSELTGMAILVDRELTRGRRSASVNGRLGARQALARLLTGTGLMAQHSEGRAFTVLPAKVSTVPSGRNHGAATRWEQGSFAAALQGALAKALCRSPLTRPGGYRAALQLWIGPVGLVEHSRLLGPTGNLRRDAALVESLRGLMIDRAPPSSLPQPVTVLVVPEAAASMECNKWEGAAGA